MTKIALYKPFKKIFFNDMAEETAAWSYEVVNLLKILQAQGCFVKILSDTDALEHQGVLDKSGPSWQTDISYDRIIIIAGAFDLASEGSDSIPQLRKLTPRLDLIVTDARLMPHEPFFPFFDNIYTQSTNGSFVNKMGSLVHAHESIMPLQYSNTDKLVCFGHKLPSYKFDRKWTTKTIDFYFGGGERGRTKSFFEFIWRPGHELRFKSTTLGVDNRVSFAEHSKLLKKSFFSIVIADDDYNRSHFVTPRIYECWMADVVAFIEHNYDPDGRQVPKDSFLRVNSYVDMKNKMSQIKNDPCLHAELIAEQRDRLLTTYFSGKTIVDTLL